MSKNYLLLCVRQTTWRQWRKSLVDRKLCLLINQLINQSMTYYCDCQRLKLNKHSDRGANFIEKKDESKKINLTLLPLSYCYRCPLYYDLPAECTLVQNPSECCQQPVCNFNQQIQTFTSNSLGRLPSGLGKLLFLCYYLSMTVQLLKPTNHSWR